MSNRVNIIAVILAVAVFVGIIVYSQSQKDNGVPVEEVSQTSGDEVTPSPVAPFAAPAPAPAPTPSTAPASKQGSAPVGARPTPASRPELGEARPEGAATAATIGADILVSNVQTAAMQANSPDQYSAQLTKLSAALSALGLNPNDAHSWIILGEVAEDFGKIESAERSYLKSIEVDPNRGGWNHLGTIYLNRASYVQAVWAYEGMLKYHPNQPQSEINLLISKAHYYIQASQKDMAVATYQLLIEKDPANKAQYEAAIGAL